MKRNFLLFLLLLTLSSFSQENSEIKGLVFNQKKEPLANALVQLVVEKKQQTINFVVTDKKGAFTLKIPTATSKANYLIKITNLGFKPFKKKVASLNTKEILRFFLEELPMQLEEIKITSEYKKFRVKKDTIVYNLSKIRDSSEVKLKDLTEKLPGISIDNNKKLRYQGVPINKVLIDGEDFFGRKHEMATENLDANAVKGISLLTNFKEFDEINDKGRGKIVLNVTLKDRYRKKIVGNLKGGVGVVEKYQLHSNIFKFVKKGNVALISEFNNIGESAINLTDYFEMQEGLATIDDTLEEDSFSIKSIDHSTIPRYVLVNNNVSKRSTNFNSLNFVRTFKERIKVNGYLTLDKTKIQELSTNNKVFINNLLPETTEKRKAFSNSFLGNSYVNVVYKKAKNQSFKYQLKVNPFKDSEIITIKNDDIFSNNFQNNRKYDDLTLSQSITHQYKISRKWFLKSSFLYDFKENNRIYKINSNKDFLLLNFIGNDFTIKEVSKKTLNSSVVKSNLRYIKSSKTAFNFSFAYNANTINLNKEVLNQAEFMTDTNRKQNILKGGVGFSYKITKKLSFRTNANYHHNSLSVNNEFKKYDWILPEISFSYKIGNTKNYVFSYKKTKENLGIHFMQRAKQIEDYQTILVGNTDYFTPKEKEEYNFSTHYQSSKYTTLISFYANYYHIKNQVGFATYFKSNHIEKKVMRTPEKGYSLTLYLNKNLKFIPFDLDTKFDFTTSTLNNQFSNSLNKMKQNSFSTDISLQSNFKNTFFQTKSTIYFSFYEYSNSYKVLDYKASNTFLKQNIYGFISKKIKWKLEAVYRNFKTTSIDKTIFETNFLLDFTLGKKNSFHFFIKGNNVFNIKSNQFAHRMVNLSFTQLSVYDKLKGYVLVGVKLDF